MATKFEIYKDKSNVTSKSGEFRWRLIHANGQVIADSGEGYTSKANAMGGIDSVKTNAAAASVDDRSN